jgi:hypothetical protein
MKLPIHCGPAQSSAIRRDRRLLFARAHATEPARVPAPKDRRKARNSQPPAYATPSTNETFAANLLGTAAPTQRFWAIAGESANVA